jgi:hypothetical protein
MKANKKRPACLNCGRPLLVSDNFCPSCGQNNTSHKMGLRTLLDDFFSNYISFDSRLARSTIPFLFKPGFLTRRFNEGKRITYVHPLRLYFIISFLFFFLLSMLINSLVEESKFSLKSMLDDVSANNMPAQVPQQPDSLLKQQYLQEDVPVFEQDSLMTARRKAPSAITIDGDDDNRTLRLMRDDALTDAQVMDSLKWDKDSYFSTTLIHQSRKVLRKDVDVFLPYLIKNLSIMMFLMLPVFALFLWILYRKQEPFYISHVIHALHMHAFSFLLLSLLVLVQLYTNTGLWPFIVFWLITLYAFISIKRVYGQGWMRTLLKFNLLGFFYFTTLTMAVMIEVFVSFMVF